VINSESRRLERIVGDMLSVSEIEAGSFKLRSGDVRLDTVFEELRADFAPQAKEKGVSLRFDLPPKLPAIKGDRDKIVLAIHNLIGNAIKYTPRSGKVVVRVVVDAGQMLVEVTDTGIGIAAEETDLIFEKFYRAKDKRVSDITGTGLGLALAREVVRLHGGDISVRSELNKGSTFTMMVPTLTEAA
jgi:two-component system phosphate regulon sensor histidine kinase PhoR